MSSTLEPIRTQRLWSALRPVAIGAVPAVVLGVLLGSALALPAEMSKPAQAPSVIRARDPNYASYLKMLASLGPAPVRRAHFQQAAFHTAGAPVRIAEAAYEPESSWDVADEEPQQRWQEPERGPDRGYERAEVVQYQQTDGGGQWRRYEAPVRAQGYAAPAPYYEPPRPREDPRRAQWQAVPARSPAPAYARGAYRGGDEPQPPPPPRPAGW